MATPKKKCKCPNCRRDDLDGDEKYCPTCGLAVERAGNGGDWPTRLHPDSPRRPFKCDDDGDPELPAGATHAPWERDPDDEGDEPPADADGKGKPKKEEKSGGGLWVIAAVIAAALIGGAIYYFLNHSSPPPGPDGGKPTTTDGGTVTDAAVNTPPTAATWIPGQAVPAGWILVSAPINLGGHVYPLDAVPFNALSIVTYDQIESAGGVSAGSIRCPSGGAVPTIRFPTPEEEARDPDGGTLWVVPPGVCIQRH